MFEVDYVNTMVADALATQKSGQDINNHGIKYTVRCRYNTVDFLQDTKYTS